MKLQGTMKVNAKGNLAIGDCDVISLVKEFGTPLIVIDEKHLREICREYYVSFMERQENVQVVYASKAFCTPAICRIIDQEKLGLDVVSGGELFTALASDFPADKIFFHGNNKSKTELEMALEHDVGRIVVDNEYELGLLNELAGLQNKKPAILLRITPGVDANTHAYIQTGQIDSKFGLTLPNGQALAIIRELDQYPNLDFKGIHCHIGSQVFDLDFFELTANIMLEFLLEIRKETSLVCQELNLGGGLGIYYTQEDEPVLIKDYANKVMETVWNFAKGHDYPMPKIIVEPGRSIVGPTGTTLYTIGSIKNIPGVRKYIAVDGGMADNIRPSLYQAKYEATIANKMSLPADDLASITGKCCESGDMLIWDIYLQDAEPGDILAVSSTGAYTYSLASNYNSLGRPAVVLARDGQADLIIKRESYEEILRKHLIPPHLQTNRGQY